jgi:hypothetical protein
LAEQLEAKCAEVQTYKVNFERLQADCNDRTTELERLSSQLQKAKQGPILQNFISAENFAEKCLPFNSGTISTLNITYKFI